MLRLAFLLTGAALLLSACGGGGEDSDKPVANSVGRSDASGGGSRAMAASMEVEFVKLKDCFQAQLDGKGDCKEDLLTNKVTGICSTVRTGTRNDFAVADVKPFEPICSAWGQLLGTPAADKPNALAGMLEKAKAIN